MFGVHSQQPYGCAWRSALCCEAIRHAPARPLAAGKLHLSAPRPGDLAPSTRGGGSAPHGTRGPGQPPIVHSRRGRAYHGTTAGRPRADHSRQGERASQRHGRATLRRSQRRGSASHSARDRSDLAPPTRGGGIAPLGTTAGQPRAAHSNAVISPKRSWSIARVISTRTRSPSSGRSAPAGTVKYTRPSTSGASAALRP